MGTSNASGSWGCASAAYEPDIRRREELGDETHGLTVPVNSREILFESIKDMPVHVELALVLIKASKLTTLCVEIAAVI